MTDRPHLLAAVLRLSPVGIGVTRLADGRIVEFNDALLDILGYSRAEVGGKTSAELNIWVDLAQRDEAFTRLARGEGIRNEPSQIRRKDGEIRSVLLSAAAVSLEGEPHFIGNLRDVTHESQLEKQRAEAEERLRLSLNVAPVTVFHMDRTLRYTFIANAQVGGIPDVIVGRCDDDLFAPDDAAKLTAIKRRVLDTGVVERAEVAVRLAGEERWFDLLVEPEIGPDDKTVGLLCAAIDVTDRRRREDIYRNVVADQMELIGRYQPDGTMLFVNEVYCRFFGKTAEQLIGRKWAPQAHPDDVDMINERLTALSPENPVITIENRVFAADGTVHWMEFVNRGLFETTGKLREIQSVGRDVTARRQAENDLASSRRQLQRLIAACDDEREELRKAIARDVHDQLGSLLTSIGFRIEAVSRSLAIEGKEDDALAGQLVAVRQLVAQANSAARDICNHLRPPALDDLGLIPTCKWYLSNWAKDVPIEVRTRFSRSSERPPEAISVDLFRIFQELLTNVAKHARATRVDVALIVSRASIRMRIADNGNGFAAHDAWGGFGLIGIRERLAKHDGKLDIDSSPAGTTVTVTVRRPDAR